jgi:hypothetical protein
MTTTSTLELFNELLPLLRGALPPERNGSVVSLCPVHDDHKPSLSISPTRGIQCFSKGCSASEIVKALRERKPAPMPEVKAVPKGKKELVATYTFSDADGTPVAEKRRYLYPDGSKTFEIYLPNAEYPGLQGMSNNDVPIYNLPNILATPNAPIYFVEGEKMAEACIEHGLLATTTIHGAGAVNFGDVLSPLVGRDVVLWPDNDPAGVTHMKRIETALKPIAGRVAYISLPFALPPKGDAVDYFEMGGTVDGLALDIPQGITVTVSGENSVKVTIPTGPNVITFEFDEVVAARRSFDTRLTVSITGGYGEPYEDDINIQSATQRDTLRRTLDTLYGKEFVWVRHVNTACNAARDAYRKIDRSIDVADIPESIGDMYLYYPLLPKFNPTIFFADGATSKTYIAMIMALCFGTGQPFLGKDTPCQPVIYVDWESDEATFRFRMNRIAKGLGLDSVPPSAVYYWSGRGMPLSTHIDGLRRLIENTNACLVVIDSIMPACDGEPEKSATALAFFNSLAQLKVTTLLIAHITKPPQEGKDDSWKKKPFGSTAWHNMARRTWYLERSQETESDIVDVGFYNRKVNDGPRPRDFGVQVVFDGMDGAVIVRDADIQAMPEQVNNRSANDRIYDYLAKNGMSSVAEIANGSGVTPTVVSARLGDDKKKAPERRVYYFSDADGKYGIAE